VRWFDVAFRRETVIRSLGVAVVVGTLLAMINHGDAILEGTFGRRNMVQVLLTYLVPYGVSTYANVRAVLSANRKGEKN
jgi:hypothetical protein